MAVAVGWRVDDHLDTFALARNHGVRIIGVPARPAILRAQIDSGISGRASARNVRKFAGIIGREKDIMMLKIKARSARMGKPHERRQRPLFIGHVRHAGGHTVAKLALRQSCGIGVGDDNIGRNCVTIGQPNAADTCIVRQHLRHPNTRFDRRAAFVGHIAQRAGERVDTAIDQPDALCLGMRDQHQSGLTAIRVRSAVGGIAAKELLQARVLEMAANRLPQIVKRAHRQCIANAPRADPHHHGKRSARAISSQEWLVEHLEYTFRLGAKGAIGRRLARPGKIADSLFAAFGTGKQVQMPGVIPGMACNHGRAVDVDVVIERLSAFGEDLVEHIAHCKNGWPARDHSAINFDLPRLAADMILFFKHGYTVAARSQQCRAGKAANSGSNNGYIPAHRLPQTSFQRQYY